LTNAHLASAEQRVQAAEIRAEKAEVRATELGEAKAAAEATAQARLEWPLRHEPAPLASVCCLHHSTSERVRGSVPSTLISGTDILTDCDFSPDMVRHMATASDEHLRPLLAELVDSDHLEAAPLCRMIGALNGQVR